ncbi:hypothetical protein M3Y99_00089600 [Aphelenchoides fujianensis]|nr:hypothetical protein M3Y99_00089600 [Aphelenchoides fujianensis]
MPNGKLRRLILSFVPAFPNVHSIGRWEGGLRPPNIRSMDYVSSLFSGLVSIYNAVNPTTLSGAIDVIVVEQPDGSYRSTPFHVRFGKLAVFSVRDKFVDIQINGRYITDGVRMKLGHEGVAFFFKEGPNGPLTPPDSPVLRTSPPPFPKPKAENDAESADVLQRLSSDQLKSLHLEYGVNDARFSITTKFQGTAWCACTIYLLKWSEKIVISDIDGTITRSDVLGHVIPVIGGTWAHAGVAELYSRIHLNGYRIVYLSARPIGQSHQTKSYLRSIAQGFRMLPDGPVLLNPASILMAFRKEVIERRPEEFKIACLQDLRSLFPVKAPFFAGFGNRETDVISYQAVGVANHRIFTIEPSSKVQSAHSFGFYTNYDSMTRDNLVDSFFPPLHGPKRATSLNEEQLDLSCDFFAPATSSPFTYWRTDPDDLEGGVDERELQKYEARRRLNQLENAKRRYQHRRFRFFSI